MNIRFSMGYSQVQIQMHIRDKADIKMRWRFPIQMEIPVSIVGEAISLSGLANGLKITSISAPNLTIATALPPIRAGLVLQSSDVPLRIESMRSLRYVDPKTLRSLNTMKLNDVPVGTGAGSKEEQR